LPCLPPGVGVEQRSGGSRGAVASGRERTGGAGEASIQYQHRSIHPWAWTVGPRAA